SVLSAYHQQRLQEAVAYFRLEAYFVRLVGLNDYRAHSKVENGRRWLRELPHDSREVLLIGDTLHDVEVAREMGVDCVLLTGGHQNSDRLRASGVTCFNTLHAIAEYVLNENF
ncbi:MAG: HAD family hydrolase, partial [Sedimentisphaerales bacterium]|nr:HAD family hydrolase [Sedimentisphaerales bacterium]